MKKIGTSHANLQDSKKEKSQTSGIFFKENPLVNFFIDFSINVTYLYLTLNFFRMARIFLHYESIPLRASASSFAWTTQQFSTI